MMQQQDHDDEDNDNEYTLDDFDDDGEYVEQYDSRPDPRNGDFVSPAPRHINSEDDRQPQEGDDDEGDDDDDALLDLEQLEELQHEAERMKALGNKHMAAQVRSQAVRAHVSV